ncbi:hypothetical protein E2I00_010961, partial [Balaenoptera physalus]
FLLKLLFGYTHTNTISKSSNQEDRLGLAYRVHCLLNELVVGDTSGKLSVYKNDDSRPWLTCSCQGMLTCVGVGDVCNKGKNLVVAVSAEGWFHLCDLTPTKAPDASGHHETLGGEEQRPVFKQHIPANTKVMLISDIDGDGCCELVVGYTDRVVRAFRWEDLGDGTEHLTGQLVLLKKWMLEGQVDSLSVTPGPLGVPELMAVLTRFCCVPGTQTLGRLPPLRGPRRALGKGGGPVDGGVPGREGNGHEEVVACAWDGQTYIIDHNRTVVRFQVDENVRAFCAGLYACKGGCNSPCLVYVTFNQKIYVYWEVQLERMESTNLLKLDRPSWLNGDPSEPPHPASCPWYLRDRECTLQRKDGGNPRVTVNCRPCGLSGEGRDELLLCPFPCVPHPSHQ